MPAKNSVRRGASLLAAGAILLICLGPARPADEPSRADIINALRGEPPSRSLTGPPAVDRSPAEQRLIDDLHKQPTRSLSAAERETLKVAARERRSIDLEIYFDRNSATIGRKAADQLSTLASALADPSLKGATFMIAGHTDAKGRAAHNQKLSERRALAVKRWLVAHDRLPAGELVAMGYGQDQLKNTADPYAAENRRVQIVNLDAKATAQK